MSKSQAAWRMGGGTAMSVTEPRDAPLPWSLSRQAGCVFVLRGPGCGTHEKVLGFRLPAHTIAKGADSAISRIPPDKANRSCHVPSSTLK